MKDGSTSLLGTGTPAAPAPPAKTPSKKTNAAARRAEAPKAAEPITWHRVLEARDVPRHGGTFHLHTGKEINSASFDIPALHRAGVKMEKIEAPLWWVTQQQNALDRVEGLTGEVDGELRASLAANGVPGLVEAPAA